MQFGGHTNLPYRAFWRGLCGQRDNFVGIATNTKATSLIFNNLHSKLVATKFSGRFSANFRSAQPPQICWHLALPARWHAGT